MVIQNPKSCDFCGTVKEKKDLIDFGVCRICLLCDINKGSKPQGTVVKTKRGMQDNSNLS